MIKLFEELSEYYIELSSDEWDNLSIKLIEFEGREIEIIKGKFNFINVLSKSRQIQGYFNWKEDCIVGISKTSDEWYYVWVYYTLPIDRRNRRNTYYKCDQFEGLLKCIDYINVIRPND